MIYLRSLLFYLGMFAYTLLLLPVLMLIALPLPQPGRYRVLTSWTRFNLWWLRLSCRLSFRVEGKENIPAGNAVILSKHQSVWETLGLQQVFGMQTWVLKREIIHIPFFGWAMAMLRPIFIDRKSGKRALDQVVEQGREKLENGLWVVIFPEGTRAAPGTRGRYKSGGAFLAAQTGYPVVPVAHNAGEFWRRHGFAKHPGVITVAVGPAIATGGRKASEITAEAEAWIEGKMQEITTLRPKAQDAV